MSIPMFFSYSEKTDGAVVAMIASLPGDRPRARFDEHIGERGPILCRRRHIPALFDYR